MIPVIIHHSGNQPYFHQVVRQALSYNERVILIGDESNKNMPGIEHFSEGELWTPAIELFKHSYIHMHHNPSLEISCACIIRWSLLAGLARKLDLQVLFACDSDVMLYTGVEEPEQSLGEYDLACSIPTRQPEFRWCASGHVSYWKRDMLVEFDEFIKSAYSDSEVVRQLKSKWDWHRETGAAGGICDMTLLWLFVQAQRQRCVDLCSPIEGTVFDHNFNEAGGYLEEDGVKSIMWKDGHPYGYHKELDVWIRFNSIHFQGVAKRILGHYIHPRR